MEWLPVDVMTNAKLSDRFWSKVDRSGGPHACWPWLAKRARNGYGSFWYEGRNVSAHRVAHVLAHGPVPAGLLVMHSCDNRPCCNPAHLSAGTASDNAHDKFRKGRGAHPHQRGDHAGKRYGRWTVREFVEYCGNAGERWTAECDCGTTSTVYVRNLTRGVSKSCGCYNVERAAEMCRLIGRPDQRTGTR